MDEDEFAALLSNHARVIASAIRRVCGRRHRTLIPDVEQEVRAALWKFLRHGKEIEHPVSYLYKVALTTALAVVRRHEGDWQTVGRDVENRPGEAPPAFLGLLPAEQARLLAEVLDRLPLEESRAIRAYLAGFNHEEVAGLYGWTASVARHRIYRGLERIRQGMIKDTA